MRVLVTDGDNRAALAVTRSLGRAGHEVIVAAQERSALAQASRYCVGRAVYPNPVTNPDSFVDAIVQLARAQHIDCVIPIADITTFLVTANRHQFEPRSAVPFADSDIVERAANKVDLLETARSIGVPVPRSVIVTAPDSCPNHDIPFPLVVKPWRSRIRTPGGWTSTSVSYAANADELRRDLAARPQHEYPVMLQERIEGPGLGVFACYHQGKPVAVFGHRRLREKPPWGGVSVLCESIALPPTTRDHATRLLDAIRWQGVAMVEFKMDRRDGQPKLMEVNGRFWGSLQLAIDSGVDFPAILLQTIGAKSIDVQMPYRVGVQSRWFWGDADSLLLTLRRWQGPWDLRPSKLRAVSQFLKLLGPNLHYDNPKPDDPWPFAFETRRRLSALVPRPGKRARAMSPAGPDVVTPGPAPATTLSTRLVSRLADVALDEHAWNALAANGQTNTIFQTHQWTRSWLDVYGDNHEPFFLVVADAGVPVAVAPLMVTRAARSRESVLRFIGSGRADYCDFLASTARADVLALLVDTLLKNSNWDLIDLTNIPAGSRLVEAMREGCRARDLRMTTRSEYQCPTLLLEEGEGAREILRKPSLRRCVTRFERAGHHEVRHAVSARDIEPQLPTFFAQHIARWRDRDSPSLFLDERNREFYRRLTRSLDGSGSLLFSSIELNGQPAAFHFGFDHAGAVIWYKPCFEPALSALSPGNVMVSHLIKYAIDHKRRELDFTVGDEPFKKRFTNLTRQTVHLQVHRTALSQLRFQTRETVAAASRTLKRPVA